MGEDKSKSIVNSHCQRHEITSLYVCDASVSYTVGVDPRYTVMAIATLKWTKINLVLYGMLF